MLSFVTICVEDIKKMVAFYRDAFGIAVRFEHESGHYTEMETGGTVLAFSQTELAESLIPCGYTRPTEKPGNVLIGIQPPDVKEAVKTALEEGATLVTDTELKPWGWLSAMIRDPEGNLIELAKEAV